MQVRKGETRHGGTGVQTQRHHHLINRTLQTRVCAKAPPPYKQNPANNKAATNNEGGTGARVCKRKGTTPLYKQNPANTGMRKGTTPLYKQNPANNKAATNNEGCGRCRCGCGGTGVQTQRYHPFINRTPQTTKRQQTTRWVGGHGYAGVGVGARVCKRKGTTPL